MEIKLNHGIALLDDSDTFFLDGWVWWSQASNRRKGTSAGTPRVYMVGRKRTEQRTSFPLHRRILGLPTYADDRRDVDHINGDGLDNRRENLRIGTRSQNLANSASRGGSSEYKGVSFDKQTGRWKAQITINNVPRNLGRHDTPEQAALAYNIAADRAWGTYAVLNQIGSEVVLRSGTRGSSHYRGVTFDKERNLWIAQIAAQGNRRQLGRFPTEADAALAYNAAAQLAFGDKARLNTLE